MRINGAMRTHRAIPVLMTSRTGLLLLACLALCSMAPTRVARAGSLVISSSRSGTGSITVDDDLDVLVNNVPVFSTHSTAGHPVSPAPIAITADAGDTVRFKVRDTFGQCASLSALYLTTPTGQSVLADPGFSLGCGRPSGDLGVVHDLSFTVPHFDPQPGDIIATEGTLLYKVDRAAGVRTVLTDFSNPAQGPTGSGLNVATGAKGEIYVTDGVTDQRGKLFRVFPDGTRVVKSDATDTTQGDPWHTPFGVAVDANGDILVTDRGFGGGGNDAGLWRVNASSGHRLRISTFGGSPESVALDESGNIVVGDAEGGTDCHTFGGCGALYEVNRTTGARTLLIDFGASAPLGEDAGRALALDTDGTFLVTDDFAPPGSPSNSGCFDTGGCGVLFTADTTAHTHSIVTAYADASQGTVDGFRPWGVVVDAGGIIFVAPCPGSHGAGAICTVNRTTGVRTVWSDWGDANQGTTGVRPLSLAIATGGSTGGASPFRPVSPGITIGPDLGGTGHPAVNATGSAGSGGKSLVALFDSTPTDPATKDVFGSVSLSADVMMTTFNNKKGAGLLALFNEAVGKKGLALILYDSGNTDSLLLATVDQARTLAVLKSIPLAGGIAEKRWYHLTMNVVVSGGNVAVTGQVFRHADPLDGDSAVGAQVGSTLSFSGPPPAGVDATGEVGIVASAFSAVVDSSVANFTINGTKVGP